MKKQIVTRVMVAFFIALVSSWSVPAYAAQSPLKLMHRVEIVVNGKVLSTVDAFTANQTTYVPLSAVTASLNQIAWNSELRSGVLYLTRMTGGLVPLSGQMQKGLEQIVTPNLHFLNRQNPDTQQAELYVELWPIMNTLKQVGVQTAWNGADWQLNASATPIEHLVVIVQENHSFDNYFGTYGKTAGFLPLPNTPAVDGIPAGAYNPGLNGKKVEPFLLTPTQTQLPDIPHGYQQMLGDYAQGTMLGFVQQNQIYLQKHHQLGFPDEPMGHYDYRTIGPYWDYAQHFALADHWFQPVFGPTSTNMLYLGAARAGQNDRNAYYTSVPNRFDFTFPNIGDTMNAHGVSWDWFQGGWYSNPGYVMDNPFMFFQNYHRGLYKGHLQDLKNFPGVLRNHELPAVTFIKPDGKDEHPGTNLENGVHFVTKTINEVMNSPYWDSTAIILTYDESGGWYDHVSPPQTGLNVDGLQGDGPRVPTLVISPFSKENYVSHQTYDTTSILKFIEYNWHLPALNRKDGNANNLLDFFDFNQTGKQKFLLGQPGYTAFPLAQRVTVRLNNFVLASTGGGMPFVHDKQVYVDAMELARNLNLTESKTIQGIVFKGRGEETDVPNGELLFDKQGQAYVPVNWVSKALKLELHWVNSSSMQIVSTSGHVDEPQSHT